MILREWVDRLSDDERDAIRQIADTIMVATIESLGHTERLLIHIRSKTRDRLGYTNVFRWAHRRSRWRDD